jgi:hypothetical protein
MTLSITVPDGPITFTRQDNGVLIARFSSLECRDNGLLVATSDFSRSIIVVNFAQSSTSLTWRNFSYRSIPRREKIAADEPWAG